MVSPQGQVSGDAVLLLIGNKADVTEGSEREVTAREGRRLAEVRSRVSSCETGLGWGYSFTMFICSFRMPNRGPGLVSPTGEKKNSVENNTQNIPKRSRIRTSYTFYKCMIIFLHEISI